MSERSEVSKLTKKSEGLIHRYPDSESIPTGLIKRLFDDAHQKFGENNYESHRQYMDEPESHAVPLSLEYTPLLLGGDARNFKMVSYIDYRNDSKSNEHSVCLSTHRTRAEAQDYLREITYEQRDAKTFVELGEFINGDHKAHFGEVPVGMFTKPQGRAEATYEVLPDGKKKLIQSFVRRTDDIILSGSEKGKNGGRWTRLFSVNEKDRLIGSDIMYADRYHTIEEENSGADVWFQIDGTLENPTHIIIQIGTLAGIMGDKLQKESRDGKVQIITRGDVKDALSFLQTEPAYQLLFDKGAIKSLNLQEVQQFVVARVHQLQQDWNNPNNIFLGHELERPIN